MSGIRVSLIGAYANAYGNAYDLSSKKNFSEPKIYMANGDLSKRWYVYFSYRNPQTGKLEKQTPIYGGANTYTQKEERLEVLNAYRKSLLKLLQKGMNPYEDNSVLEGQLFDKPEESPAEPIATPVDSSLQGVLASTAPVMAVNTETVPEPQTEEEPPVPAIKDAFALVLKIKENVLSKTSLPGFRSNLKRFEKWLYANGYENRPVDRITKKTVIAYLNEVLEKTSPRTRNNTRIDISSIFQVLEDNEMIRENFVKKINVLKATPERNKTYTETLQADIFDHMEAYDPLLLLFVKFVSYNYLRPIEVCRLRVGDIDVHGKRLYVKAKNSPVKTKIIPELLIQQLPDLSAMDRDWFLFTPVQVGGEWDISEKDKRDYFTKRFKKVKEHFKLGKEYGLYSFRHTFITRLYNEFAKTMTPFEAKSKLMLITGHNTMEALEKYLREIDAVLPEDYSGLL